MGNSESFHFWYLINSRKRSLLGDRFYQPANFTELVDNLTSYEYATEFYEKILDETQDFEYYEPAFEIMEDEGTSHMSVVDQNGMACALTSTINTILGSKVRVIIAFNIFETKKNVLNPIWSGRTTYWDHFQQWNGRFFHSGTDQRLRSTSKSGQLHWTW